MWNKALSTSPGARVSSAAVTLEAGLVAPFTGGEAEAQRSNLPGCVRCQLCARPLTPIPACPPQTRVIVHPSCSKDPKFSKAAHLPRSHGLWAVMTGEGGPSVQPHLWSCAPRGLGSVLVGIWKAAYVRGRWKPCPGPVSTTTAVLRLAWGPPCCLGLSWESSASPHKAGGVYVWMLGHKPQC